MPAYPFNPSTFTWNPGAPHRGGSFRPRGRLLARGLVENPPAWESARTVTGRLIVGFNVGEVPTYSLDHLIAIVERVRRQQVGTPDSTFIAQKGIYTHRDGQTVAHEDGAQVFIINLSGATDEEFQAELVQLAEIVAREMQQETVIVEIQVNGISQVTIGVEP